ncbi:ankyrin repeat domain-containing protein [Urechidicola vernalis]|uniref:Ankyrin repeat domain-containing protein n=1 Tax=Urechidicola vernalis TaxID=3075600 RepID=A0ABU2Y834_9FLAO|nr:ankyrin repeat domain-containing protein [Urechidicola sp. P050]MDT0553405.1 ankyrin repeat domain-containing protein [Urechidicola sp. P050]
MKKVLLATLFSVAIGFNSQASNEAYINHKESLETYISGVNTFCKMVQQGNVDAVLNLINTGTNINQKSGGMTPLMYAARQNKVEIVKLLIARGAKLKIKSEKGLTALDYAKQSKAKESYTLIAQAMNA